MIHGHNANRDYPEPPCAQCQGEPLQGLFPPPVPVRRSIMPTHQCPRGPLPTAQHAFLSSAQPPVHGFRGCSHPSPPTPAPPQHRPHTPQLINSFLCSLCNGSLSLLCIWNHFLLLKTNKNQLHVPNDIT